MRFDGTMRGAAHPGWKGGTRVNKDGYLQISAGPLRGEYVHRIVAQAKLGRPLNPGEEVHHKNGNPLDCTPDNLEVMSEHEHDRECVHFRKRYRLRSLKRGGATGG